MSDDVGVGDPGQGMAVLTPFVCLYDGCPTIVRVKRWESIVEANTHGRNWGQSSARTKHGKRTRTKKAKSEKC